MEIRQPAVAGLFYPDDPSELAATVDQCLSEHARPPMPDVRALVVPHAGYVYSGSTAATAYSCLSRGRRYKYVLLIGPSHRVAFDGIAVTDASRFATPLGMVDVATKPISALVKDELVQFNPMAHSREHSLEVQLPFLQRLEIDAPILPCVVGRVSGESVAALIQPALEDPDVLTLISTDMSHFLTYDEARITDAHTHKRLLRGAADIDPNEACGCMGLNGLQLALRSLTYRMHLLAHCNSGDVSGDQSRVVGYATYAVY